MYPKTKQTNRIVVAWRYSLLLLFALLLAPAQSYGQPGTLDLSFNASDNALTNGFSRWYVNTIVKDANGKIVVGGDFERYNNHPSSRIIRLNSDLSIDHTFNVGSGFGWRTHSIVIQPDGKLIVGGWFQAYNGQSVNYLVRLNSDGSLDNTFNTGSGPNNHVESVLLLASGKVLVGGKFSEYDGNTVNGLVRLNSNGSIDNTFNAGTALGAGVGSNTYIRKMLVTSNGDILVAGKFMTFNGQSRVNIALLDADGVLDSGFDSSTGTALGGNASASEIMAIYQQSDGKFLVGGLFDEYQSGPANYVVRLNADATRDNSFVGEPSGYIESIQEYDGKIYIGGSFWMYGSEFVHCFTRLNMDGTLDNSFYNTGSRTDNVLTAYIEGDGSILVGGWFEIYRGVARSKFARLNSDGTLAPLSSPYTGVNSRVNDLHVFPDGRTLIAGIFVDVNGQQRDHLAMLTPNGQLDASFNQGNGADNQVYDVHGYSDNRMLIGGAFGAYNSQNRPFVTRVLQDGSFDPSFSTSTNVDLFVRAIDVDANGKILIGGDFASVDGQSRNRLARLNDDGTLDLGFDVGTGANQGVYAVVVLSSGDIIAAGNFTTFNNAAHSRIVKLDETGAIVPIGEFNSGTGANGRISKVYAYSDGRLLIVGQFTEYNGVSRNRIARLNADGSLDNSFNPGTGFNDEVHTALIQSDDKILVGGHFFEYNGYNVSRFVRLNADGSVDNSFNMGSGPNDEVVSIGLQPGGSIIIAGTFDQYNGTARTRIARVFNDAPSTPATFSLSNPSALSGYTGTTPTLEFSLENIAGLGVSSVNLALTYDPTKVTINPLSIDVDGTILEGANISTSSSVPGTILISLARAFGQPITSDGVFMKVPVTLDNVGSHDLSIAARAWPNLPLLPAPAAEPVFPGAPYSGTITAAPVIAQFQPAGMVSFPGVVNTGQQTFLTLTLDGAGNWATLALDQGGTLTLLASIQDGSPSDQDNVAGTVRFALPASTLGGVGTYTLAGLQTDAIVNSQALLDFLNPALKSTATVQVVNPPPSGVWGNVDGDGMLSPVDVSYLLQFVVELRDFDPEERNWLDVSVDGVVNSLDASYLLQKLLTPGFCLPAEDCVPKTSNFQPALAWRTATDGESAVYELVLSGHGAVSVDLRIEGLGGAGPGWVQLQDNWLMASNTEGGILRVALAGADPAADGSAILRIPASAVTDWSKVSFTRAELNGASVAAPTPPGVTTSLDGDPSLPTEFGIEPNFPNPFNPTTTLRVNLPEAAEVSVRVYDLAGRMVMQLPARGLQAGRHSITVDASWLSSGVYLYRVTAGNFEGVGKMTLMK